jgi:hypothetical protein
VLIRYTTRHPFHVSVRGFKLAAWPEAANLVMLLLSPRGGFIPLGPR